MAEANAFVAAILAKPADDVRLAFADWLEERSDHRAGCLRLAARVRASYGPRGFGQGRLFWHTVGQGIKPAWWAEEARRLAEEVQERVGDGGKTAVLVALALTEAALLFPGGRAGTDAVALRRAAAEAVEAVNRLSVQPRLPAEIGRSLQTAALGDEEIAEALLSAIARAGKDGLIHIRRARTARSERVRVTVQQGLHFSLGGMAGQEGRELQRAAVLVSLRRLQAEETRRALEAYPPIAAGLLCCCPGLDGDGAELFHDDARVLLCAAPRGRWQDCFEDLAAATGASLIGPDEAAPAEITAARLGRVGSARVEGGRLVIEQPAGPHGGGAPWIAHLRQLIEEASEDEREWQWQRLARLTGGVVTMEVCGGSPLETQQLYQLSCCALHAGRATIAYGYVPGGGVAYLRGGAACLDEPPSQAMCWALEEPTRTLLAGAGMGVSEALVSLRADESVGLDVLREDLPPWRTEGPIDSTRVVRSVIESATASAIRAGAAARQGGLGS